MTDWTMQSTDRDPRTLLGAFFSRRTADAADLAKLIRCDKRTARNYRDGRYWPQAKHWVGIVAAFGEDVTQAVFHPEAAIARLEKEAREREEDAQRARLALEEAVRAAAGPRRPVARHEDRAAALTRESAAP
jgi:hypothetical protein